MTDAGSFLDGFHRVHKGFKDRVYPERVSELGEIRPYDAIALAIRTVSKHLRKEAKKRGVKNQEVGGYSWEALLYSQGLVICRLMFGLLVTHWVSG